MQDDLTGDEDRGELRELLLDSVPHLDDGQRDAMFQHTFESPAEDEHATDDLIPDDGVFDGGDDDWDSSFDVADDGTGVAADAVEDVHGVAEPEPEHDFADDSETPHETHDTPDELSDPHDFGDDHGAGVDHHADPDIPDADGHWS